PTDIAPCCIHPPSLHDALPILGWDRPLLTDSGGFQVFSLEGFRRVHEDGVEFQSHVDGSRRHLTPERATEIQWVLGADIAMAFRSEEHTSELQSRVDLVCRLLL